VTVNPGDIINVAIKGVRAVHHPSARLVRIVDEHGDTYDMPPQAAIEREPADGAETTQDDRIAKVLACLDGMEAEGYIQPYVAIAVRKVAGEPPRHWPPQPGDVWDDGYPFGSPLWFAQVVHDETKHSRLVMVPTEGDPEGMPVKTPEEFMEYAVEPPLLAYRRKDSGR